MQKTIHVAELDHQKTNLLIW